MSLNDAKHQTCTKLTGYDRYPPMTISKLQNGDYASKKSQFVLKITRHTASMKNLPALKL